MNGVRQRIRQRLPQSHEGDGPRPKSGNESGNSCRIPERLGALTRAEDFGFLDPDGFDVNRQPVPAQRA